MQRRLITVHVYEGCYLFVCLHILIYHVCLKYLPSAQLHVLCRVYR